MNIMHQILFIHHLTLLSACTPMMFPKESYLLSSMSWSSAQPPKIVAGIMINAKNNYLKCAYIYIHAQKKHFAMTLCHIQIRNMGWNQYSYVGWY